MVNVGKYTIHGSYGLWGLVKLSFGANLLLNFGGQCMICEDCEVWWFHTFEEMRGSTLDHLLR